MLSLSWEFSTWTDWYYHKQQQRFELLQSTLSVYTYWSCLSANSVPRYISTCLPATAMLMQRLLIVLSPNIQSLHSQGKWDNSCCKYCSSIVPVEDTGMHLNCCMLSCESYDAEVIASCSHPANFAADFVKEVQLACFWLTLLLTHVDIAVYSHCFGISHALYCAIHTCL